MFYIYLFCWFRDCSVCELGGGMTCLAGIAVSIIQLIKYLLIYPFSWWIIGKITDLIKEIIVCVPNIGIQIKRQAQNHINLETPYHIPLVFFGDSSC